MSLLGGLFLVLAGGLTRVILCVVLPCGRVLGVGVGELPLVLRIRMWSVVFVSMLISRKKIPGGRAPLGTRVVVRVVFTSYTIRVSVVVLILRVIKSRKLRGPLTFVLVFVVSLTLLACFIFWMVMLLTLVFVGGR